MSIRSIYKQMPHIQSIQYKINTQTNATKYLRCNVKSLINVGSGTVFNKKLYDFQMTKLKEKCGEKKNTVIITMRQSIKIFKILEPQCKEETSRDFRMDQQDRRPFSQITLQFPHFLPVFFSFANVKNIL